MIQYQGMDLQSLVTDNLAGDKSESSLSLWDEREQEYLPREALGLGEAALASFPNGNWREPAARFAIRLLHHKEVLHGSLGTQLMIRILGYDEDPATAPELEDLLRRYIERVELEVRLSSSEEAFAYLEGLWGEEAAEIISLASGTKTPTVRKWMDGRDPAKTRLRKIYSLVRVCHEVVPLLGPAETRLWLQKPLPDWNTSPIKAVAKVNYDAIPYEARMAIRDLRKAHSQEI